MANASLKLRVWDWECNKAMGHTIEWLGKILVP